MNELVLLYLWTRLDILHSVVTCGMIVGWVAVLTCVLFSMSNPDGWHTQTCKADAAARRAMGQKYLPAATAVAVVSTALAIIVPTQKDAAIIAGGWLVKEAATSEIAKNIGERTYKLIVGKLDEELDKLEGKAKK